MFSAYAATAEKTFELQNVDLVFLVWCVSPYPLLYIKHRPTFEETQSRPYTQNDWEDYNWTLGKKNFTKNQKKNPASLSTRDFSLNKAVYGLFYFCTIIETAGLVQGPEIIRQKYVPVGNDDKSSFAS